MPKGVKHEKTPLSSNVVNVAKGMGMKTENIALLLGIDKVTLFKYYKEEMKGGGTKVEYAALNRLYHLMTGNKINQATQLRAIEFYLQTQKGWRKTDGLALQNPDGSAMDQPVRAIKRVIVDPPARAEPRASKNG